jgi:Secretion system C-terminal sorting domain
MRPFYFLLFLLFAQKITVAQNQYIPMVKEGKYWFVSKKDIVTQKDVYYIHTFKGDSMVDNVSYKKLVRFGLYGTGNPAITTNSYLVALVREDTVERKVYQILKYPIVPSCASEHIMYDFSLNIGDTLDDCMLAIWKSAKLPSRTIDTMQFKTIGQKNRRGLSYTAWTLEDFLKVLEPFTYYEGYGYENSGVVLDGAWCYEFCEGSLDDCNIILANLELEEKLGLQLSPNPVTATTSSDLNISYKSPDFSTNGNASILLTDCSGRVLQNIKVDHANSISIDVSDLDNGLYFVHLRQRNRVLAVEKLVVVH